MCRCFWKMTEDGSLTYYNRVFGGQAELMHINATSHTSSGQQQQHHKDHDHNHTEVHKEGFGRDLREWGEHEDTRAGAKGTPTNFLICILSTENTRHDEEGLLVMLLYFQHSEEGLLCHCHSFEMAMQQGGFRPFSLWCCFPFDSTNINTLPPPPSISM